MSVGLRRQESPQIEAFRAPVGTRRHDGLSSFGAAALVAAAVGFLLYRLAPDVAQKPLYEDEAIAGLIAMRPLREVLDTVLVDRGGAPLHFVLAHAVFRVDPTADALRWLSVAAALGAVPLCFDLARRLANPVAGIVAAAVAASSTALAVYGSFGRMYALFVFVAALRRCRVRRRLAARRGASLRCDPRLPRDGADDLAPTPATFALAAGGRCARGGPVRGGRHPTCGPRVGGRSGEDPRVAGQGVERAGRGAVVLRRRGRPAVRVLRRARGGGNPHRVAARAGVRDPRRSSRCPPDPVRARSERLPRQPVAAAPLLRVASVGGSDRRGRLADADRRGGPRCCGRADLAGKRAPRSARAGDRGGQGGRRTGGARARERSPAPVLAGLPGLAS